MDVIILAQYMGNMNNIIGNNNRFPYLAQMISKYVNLEVITTDFEHISKRHYSEVDSSLPYKVTLLHELGYQKNVSLKRFVSHRKFAKNVKKYLENRQTPDIIYSAVPSLDVADIAAEYCKNNNIRFIIDIQDLWPEAFKMVFNIPILSNIIFFPMKKKANNIYAQADEIIAVSETYAKRAMQSNRNCERAEVVYLGTDLKAFDEYRLSKPISEREEHLTNQIFKNNHNIISLVYVGTLGHSYDITLVLKAMRMLDNSLRDKIQFIVMGDGPLKEKYENEAMGLPVVFTGSIPYPVMVRLLCNCDIAINPIVSGAAQSIINKHMDYAMAGLPVINTQENIEYRNLVDGYKCGINCECGDVGEVCEAIEKLVINKEMRLKLGMNHRKLGEERFAREISYQIIKNKILDT